MRPPKHNNVENKLDPAMNNVEKLALRFPGLAIPNKIRKPLEASSDEENDDNEGDSLKKNRVTSSAIFKNEKNDKVVDEAMSQLEALAPSSSKPKLEIQNFDDKKLEKTKKEKIKSRSRSPIRKDRNHDRDKVKRRRSSSRGRSRSRHRSNSRNRNRSRSRNRHRGHRSRSKDKKYIREHSKKTSNGRYRSKSRDKRSRSRSRGRRRNRSKSYERRHDNIKHSDDDSPKRLKQKSHGFFGAETIKDDPLPGKVFQFFLNIYT